jgi:hypothetical protein
MGALFIPRITNESIWKIGGMTMGQKNRSTRFLMPILPPQIPHTWIALGRNR